MITRCFNPLFPRRFDLLLPDDCGGTIRRELDFQTRVCVLASTTIPIGNVGDEKKPETREDVLSGR